MGNDDTSNYSEAMPSHPFDTELSTPSSDANVNARMDQLQNQLNQVLLMMQQNQEHPAAGNLSFTQVAGICYSQLKTFTFIASFNSSSKNIWIIDSGATDHICT